MQNSKLAMLLSQAIADGWAWEIFHDSNLAKERAAFDALRDSLAGTITKEQAAARIYFAMLDSVTAYFGDQLSDEEINELTIPQYMRKQAG